MEIFQHRYLQQWMPLLTLIAFLHACGSTQKENCDFQIESILSGENIPTQISEWDCQSQNNFFTFALFSNNTGVHSSLGNFTWQDQGCGNYTYNSQAGSGQVSNLTLQAESRQLNYTDNFQGQFSSVFCTLDETPDGISF